MQCLNCGSVVEDEFCGKCGQKAATVRLSTSVIVKQFLESVLHIRKGFPYTLKQLVLNPGKSIREFVDGGRVNWYKPLAFVMLCGLVAGIVMQTINPEIAQVSLDETADPVVQEFSQNINNWMFQHFSLITLIYVPIYALFSWLFFIRSGMNYAENLILNGYTQGLTTGVSIFPWLATTLTDSDVIKASLIGGYFVLTVAYTIISYVRFFGSRNRWLASIRALLAYACSMFIFMILAMISALIYLFGSGMLDGDHRYEGMSIIHKENRESSFVENRDFTIHLPSTYWEHDTAHFPVIYMHDGQNLFTPDSAYIGVEWEVDEAMELRAYQGKNVAIVVGIHNTPARYWEYAPEKPLQAFLDEQGINANNPAPFDHIPAGGPKGDAYLKFIEKEVKPWVDKTFRTKVDRENTMIAGSSMGGLISWYALCEHPEVFGRAACVSTHWPGGDPANDPSPFPYFLDYLDENLPDSDSARIWFDHGTATLDSLYAPYQLQVDSLMRAKGYDGSSWTTRIYPDEEHSERAWKKRVPEILDFLLD